MIDSTTVLTKEELEIFINPVYFQRKTKVSNFVIASLEKLNEQLTVQEIVKEVVSKFELPTIQGKVSKGENYLGYPWQILDYPRVFNKENIFAFRTLCWWGNFYSCTLHIAGSYYTQLFKSIASNLKLLLNEPVYICVNTNQWEHHYQNFNYRLLKDVVEDEGWLKKITDQQFIKLSLKFSLVEIDQLEKNAIYSFQLLTKIITHTSMDQ